MLRGDAQGADQWVVRLDDAAIKSDNTQISAGERLLKDRRIPDVLCPLSHPDVGLSGVICCRQPARYRLVEIPNIYACKTLEIDDDMMMSVRRPNGKGFLVCKGF